MAQFANKTTVSVEKSKAEIERLLVRYGATGFFTSWEDDPPCAMVGFKISGRMVKLAMDVPKQDDDKFVMTSNGKWRTKENAFKAWEQAQRQRWRALKLIVQAKLEAVECGLSTVEREFLADIVMQDGSSFGDWASPQIEDMYSSGKMPPLLGAAKKRKRLTGSSK